MRTDRYRRLGMLVLMLGASLVLPGSNAFAQVDLGVACDGPTTQCLNDTVKDAVKPITGTVDEVEKKTGLDDGSDDDGGTGGTVGGVVNTLLPSGGSSGGKEPRKSPKKQKSSGPARGGTRVAAPATSSSSSIPSFGSVTLAARAERAARGLGRSQIEPAAAFTQEPRQTLFDDFVQGLTEAAGRLGFPLLLTLMVIAFLVVQGRVDHRDPKLALARVSSEQDYLSFS